MPLPLRWEPSQYTTLSGEVADHQGTRYLVSRHRKGARTWDAFASGVVLGVGHASKEAAKEPANGGRPKIPTNDQAQEASGRSGAGETGHPSKADGRTAARLAILRRRHPGAWGLDDHQRSNDAHNQREAEGRKARPMEETMTKNRKTKEKLAKDLIEGDRIVDDDETILIVESVGKGFVRYKMDDGSECGSVLITYKNQPKDADWSQLPSAEPITVAGMILFYEVQSAAFETEGSGRAFATKREAFKAAHGCQPFAAAVNEIKSSLRRRELWVRSRQPRGLRRPAHPASHPRRRGLGRHRRAGGRALRYSLPRRQGAGNAIATVTAASHVLVGLRENVKSMVWAMEMLIREPEPAGVSTYGKHFDGEAQQFVARYGDLLGWIEAMDKHAVGLVKGELIFDFRGNAPRYVASGNLEATFATIEACTESIHRRRS